MKKVTITSIVFVALSMLGSCQPAPALARPSPTRPDLDCSAAPVDLRSNQPLYTTGATPAIAVASAKFARVRPGIAVLEYHKKWSRPFAVAAAKLHYAHASGPVTVI
jgi:hypothetical protein